MTLLVGCKKTDEVNLLGNISGTVTDATSKSPIAGAIVTLSPTNSSTQTGSDGKYSFKNLDPRDYKIDVASDGYTGNSKTITVTAGETTFGDLSLSVLQPVLDASVMSLDFGESETQLPIVISNTGKGELSWSVTENIPWLSVNPTSGKTTTQKSSIVVTVDRTGMSQGSNSQTISILSNGGVKTITISMIVGNPYTPKVTTGSAMNVSQTTADITANVVSIGSGAVSQYGHCYSTTPNATIANSKTSLGTMTSASPFTSSLSGLQKNTTYYVRAYATNSSGTGYSAEITFTTSDSPTLPNITIQSATNITTNSATIGGVISSLGTSSISQYGHCWSTSSSPTTADMKTTLGTKTSIGTYSSSMSALLPGTTYYVRAYATNNAGTTYSSEISFTTLPTPAPPTVTTGTTNNITLTGAIVSGTITNLGTSNISDYGHCWSTSQNPTVSGQKTSLGAKSTTGVFSSSLTGLDAKTIYYVRAYATNSEGTSYGNQIQFNTLSPTVPTLTTSAATNLTYKTATLNGNLTNLGGDGMVISEYGFCYATTPAPTTVNTKVVSGTNKTTIGAFSSDVVGLSQNTTYYVRAYATNSEGPAYGAEKTFTTPADPYTVSDGLLAFYNFDSQNANDALGSFNGVAVGGLSYSTSTPSSSGYAAQFDGTTGYINIPYQIFPSSGSWSFCLWIKTNKNYAWILKLSNSWGILFDNSSTLYLEPTWSGSTLFSNNLSNALLNNNWHLLVITSNTSVLKYYIDGSLNENVSNQYQKWGNHDFTRLGGLNDSKGGYFSGSMDNIRFYNRELTTTEITTLYKAKQ